MDISTMLPVLLTWAVHLSGYATPAEAPQLQFQPHSFFVENVCGNKECRAVGWYNDEGIIYIDEKYEDAESQFAESLLVHEIVHYLQDISGKYDSFSCTDSVAREREAYYIQNEFLLQAHASFDLVQPGPTACAYKNAALDNEQAPHHHHH